MKKALIALAGLAFLTGVYSFKPGNDKKQTALTVNTVKSRIDWVASKKSDFHTGYFPIKSGQVMVDGSGKLTGGKFILDMSNVKVTDAGGGDGLNGHLKRADFFDVEKFAEATFEITNVSYSADNVANITGNVTIKGTTVPVSIVANIRNSDEKGFFAQSFVNLDRTVLGINYGLGNVSKDVQLAIHIFAK